MTNGQIHYRAHGGGDYSFRFVWLPQQSTWRVYILQQPPYRGRATGDHATHRLGLPNMPYVCWTDPLRTYEEARAVTALWADATQHYIATGGFDPPAGRASVTDRSTYATHSEQQLRAALTEGRRGPSRTTTPTTTNPHTPAAAHQGPIRRLLEFLS